MAEILETLNEKSLKKSHISFKSKLDSRAVTRYLDIMMRNKLVKKSEDDSSYFLVTKNGLQFLKTYQELVGFVSPDFTKK